MTETFAAALFMCLIMFAIEPTVFAKPVAKFVTAVQEEMSDDQ